MLLLQIWPKTSSMSYDVSKKHSLYLSTCTKSIEIFLHLSSYSCLYELVPRAGENLDHFSFFLKDEARDGIEGEHTQKKLLK